MKKKLAFLLSAILTICSFSPGIWARDNGVDNVHKSIKTGKSIQTKHLTEQSPSETDHNGRFKLEIRKGASVAQRATQLRARNRGFARAYSEMLRRGGKPLFEEAGISVVARDSKQSATVKVSTIKVSTAAAQQIGDGEYEMTFFPFDTGNDAVWEGTIYVRGPASEGTWAVSFSTTHEDISDMEIYYENFYAPDGTEIDQAATPRRDGGSLPKAGFVAAGSKGAPKAVAYQRFQSWFNCVNMACYTAARACIWTGPFYFICFNSWCLNAMISCIPPIF